MNGTQHIVNSTTVEIGDNKIVLNAAGSLRDAGIIANVDNTEYEFIFNSNDSVWYANEAIQSGTGFMGDIQGNLTSTGNLDTTGNVNLTNSAINIEFTDAGDGNSANNTFLIVKSTNADPQFQHKIVQETSDHDTYEISSISDNTGANTRERFRLGGYQNQFSEIQLVAQNGVKVWSSHSNPNVMGNIDCGNVNGNLTGDVNGNLTGDVNGNLTGDVTGNVSGVLTGSMTMTGHILPDTNSTYDIGSAEYKIRHMYLSNNSLWIGDEHKATINPSNNQLEFRRRKTDEIPQSFVTAGINDTSQILSAAGVAALTEMTLGKWKQVARSLGITINGKSNLDIDPTDIFDTSESDDWQTTLDVKSIADDVSSLQGNVTTITGVANSALTSTANNTAYITDINSSILSINSDISTIQGNISSLQTSVASKQDTITSSTDLTMQNLTLSGYLRGPTNMTIDPATHGDDTRTLIVKGNLQVLGTTTTINSETLTINDNSIILNNNYSESSPSENAGIQIERGTLSNAIIQWNESDDQWEFYREGTGNLSNIKCNTLKVNNSDTLGSISASFSGSVLTINGNANISYGVCKSTGNPSGNPSTLSTLSVSNIEKNTQILIYYTNNSGGDIYIDNTLTISDATCKTNLSEQLTISNDSSALFCIVNIGDDYILTISQLY